MKKEVKTEITKEKIINAALQEFGINGYGAASVNAVCERHHISKGLIYHNFHSKDEIYLSCIEKIFQELTDYIKDNLDTQTSTSDEKLKAYLLARSQFFSEHAYFLKIFCEAIIFPPSHLETHIEEIRKKFDLANTEVIRELTADLRLRLDISEQKLIDTFCHSFDLIDAVSQIRTVRKGKFPILDKTKLSAVDILLYGMVER